MRLLFIHAYSTSEPASCHLRLAASDVHRFLASWLPSKRICNLCQQKPCSQALAQLSRRLQYWDVTDEVFELIKHCLGANWGAGQTVPVAPLQRHNLAGAWANMRLRINYTYFAEQKNCRYISSQTIRTCIFVKSGFIQVQVVVHLLCYTTCPVKVSSKQWIGLQNEIHFVIAFFSLKGV